MGPIDEAASGTAEEIAQRHRMADVERSVNYVTAPYSSTGAGNGSDINRMHSAEPVIFGCRLRIAGNDYFGLKAS